MAEKPVDPDTVIASAEVVRAADGYRFAPIGARYLKGFDEPVELFLLEGAASERYSSFS